VSLLSVVVGHGHHGTVPDVVLVALVNPVVSNVPVTMGISAHHSAHDGMLSVAIKDDRTQRRGAPVTDQGSHAADDELWTPGEAAAYLNAGGVNLGFKPRRITDMIKREELIGVRTAVGGWRRTPASAIRRLRAEQLAALGRTDPDFPLAKADDPDQGEPDKA
jgi:hypothetical protein